MLNTTIDVIHYGNGKSTVKNTGQYPIKWRDVKEGGGRVVSFKEVDVPPGGEKTIQL